MQAPDLSVPGYADRLLVEVELNPGRVEEWLASLPLLNPAAAGRKLHDALAAYNRMNIDPALRLQLLELLRPPIHHVVSELRKRYVGLPLPLPEKHRRAAQQTQEFHRELAYGYKLLVLAPPQSARAPAETALAVHRAIRHLTEMLLAAYLSYAPYEGAVWREIHALYRHAEELGVAHIPVTDRLREARPDTSVADAYKHALLLDLADPYHLPSRMVAKIDQYLQCYAGLATLHREFDRVEPNCHFLIDPQNERAGILYSNEAPPEPAAGGALLNTIELARHIHAQLTSFRAGELPNCALLPPGFYRIGGEEMLLRLINVWGLNPKRTYRRSARTNAKIEVLVGLPAIHYWFSGGPFVVSGARMGPFPRGQQPGADAGDPQPPHEYLPAWWEVQDESAGGMALRKTGLVSRRVKVGDLVATRFDGDEQWSLAVVRWVKSHNPSHVEIGTQRLAPGARAVVIKVIDEHMRESEFLPALLLPEIPALGEPVTLVTPGNIFRPNRIIHVDDGRTFTRLVAREVLEASGSFERIDFAADAT
ncbi:MAG TPA: hypothetical protein VF203_06955 [Burkholderiales bacterium]